MTIEQRLQAKLSDEPALRAGELGSSDGTVRAEFEGIEFENVFVREKVSNGAAGRVFEAIPAGLDDSLVETGTTSFESDVRNSFFRAETSRRPEMVAQFALNQREVATDGIGQE